MNSEDRDKDAILRGAFARLRPLGITSAWAAALRPHHELLTECRGLMADVVFTSDLRRYLQDHSALERALQMFYTYIAMSARARWEDVPEDIRPVTARGWFLGRWLPTFLIIDGPLGRFISDGDSPLSTRTSANAPLLASARDFLNNRVFRLLRNGFAHWAFEWDIVGRESYVVAYDWERDLPTAKLHQSDADAFHIVAFALIEIIDGVFISQRLLADADA